MVFGLHETLVQAKAGLLPLADGEFLKLAFFSKTNLQSSGCVSTPGSGLILILGTHCTKLSFVFRGPPTMDSKGHDRYWCTPRYRCTKVYPLRLYEMDKKDINQYYNVAEALVVYEVVSS
jgi:hypothetical protein